MTRFTYEDKWKRAWRALDITNGLLTSTPQEDLGSVYLLDHLLKKEMRRLACCMKKKSGIEKHG